MTLSRTSMFSGAAILLALIAAGCKYDPVVPEGIVVCALASDCPAGYQCVARPSTDSKVCCKSARCGLSGPDPDASTDDDGPTLSDTGPLQWDAARTIDTADPGDTKDLAPPPADSSADGPAEDAPIDMAVPPTDTATDTAPACPTLGGGPAMVRAGGYCIDSTEVTNQQYDTFLMMKGGDVTGQPNACSWNTTYRPISEDVFWPPGEQKKNFPVVNVDWCDAFMFCKWAGKRLCGKIGGGRLTSVTASKSVPGNQWMSACTGGGRYAYPLPGAFQQEHLQPGCGP